MRKPLTTCDLLMLTLTAQAGMKPPPRGEPHTLNYDHHRWCDGDSDSVFKSTMCEGRMHVQKIGAYRTWSKGVEIGPSTKASSVIQLAASDLTGPGGRPELQGAMAVWFDGYDADALDISALKGAGDAPKGILEAFRARLDTSLEMTRDMNHFSDFERECYWDVPLAARDGERRWWALHSEVLAQAEALATEVDQAHLNGAVDAEWLDRLLGARDAYVEACSVDRDPSICLSDRVGWLLTERIARSAIDVKDGALAMGEVRLMEGLTRRDEEPYLLNTVVSDCRRAEHARLAARRKAIDAGVDASLVDDQYGPRGDAPGVYPNPTVFGMRPPAQTVVGSADLRSVKGPFSFPERQVKTIKRYGDHAIVTLAAIRSSQDYQTGCVETNRISSVEYDDYGSARVYYELECTGPKRTEVTVDSVGPIRVPLRDVAHLEVGHVAKFIIAADNRGVLTHARTADGALLVSRGFRMTSESD